jgi:hypothetical protein
VCLDEISTKKPLSEDDAPVNSANKKAHLQKRLILCEIKEGYLRHKEMNPEAAKFFTVCKLTSKKKKMFYWREW